MADLTVGSLFSGGGGLDIAVERLLPGASVVWCAETDPHALEVYQRRWDVPNLGDLSAVDWTEVEPVDVLVGGYPCQPWSTAGRRKGQEDTRDGWPWFRDAIRHLGPRLVLLENVRGHVVPAGAGRTVGDLSDLGYDAVWTTLRASDVGAPHRRERWFCAAYERDGDPAPDAERFGGAGRGEAGDVVGPTGAGEAHGEQRERDGDAAHHCRAVAPDADGAGPQGRQPQQQRPDQRPARPRGVEASRERGRVDAEQETGPREELRGVRQGADTEAIREPSGGPDPLPGKAALRPELREQSEGGREAGPPLASAAAPRPAVRDVRDGGGAARSPQGPESGEQRPGQLGDPVCFVPSETALARGSYCSTSGCPWGEYGPAVHRWERILGRTAPSPTDDRGRLSPPFVEFMMGWPAGHVTGLPRTAALRVLGNGVVPDQAHCAYAHLLDEVPHQTAGE